MLKVNLICVGRPNEKYYAEAAGEYIKRLGAYCALKVTEVAESRLPLSPSPGDIKRALEREGSPIISALPRSGPVIALCAEGEAMTSESLAAYIAARMLEGKSSLTFIVGSSFGLSPEVKAAADTRLSLSPMCFAHSLARVMLLEQLYRCMSINAGGKYNK